MADWTYYFILLAFLAAGLWINILTLPGLWLMVLATAIYAWVTNGIYIGWPGLIALTILAGLAEIVEFVAGGAGAAKAGGSKRAFVGALVGGILGAIFFSIPLPIIGTIIGIVLGTFLGAVAVEVLVKKDTGIALRVGYGAAIGRLIGIITKVTFGLVMFVVGAVVAWPNDLAPITAIPPAPPPPATVPATLPATLPAAQL
ncbi:MAG TPA: DUF456 domain-containing protein [Tepidisphaeraceae bacterium]|jgi:hypothetical protein|nr:DUF456 domain-containing protein [Tepidisphaeraceae bacterium]